MRLTKPMLLAVLALLFAFAGDAMARRGKMDLLQANQYAWSGAIRWGDFEGALSLIEPGYREAHPVTDLELKRYEQVQITSYRERTSSADKKGGVAVRDIEIGLINRHTQVERTVRYREQWRWDEATKNWWLESPLPDLWDGE